jgi:hypothetical protein
MLHGTLAIIKVCKIMFFLSPVYLGLMPYLLYYYRREQFIYGTIIMILMYVMVLDLFIYRKTLLRELKESEGNESLNTDQDK